MIADQSRFDAAIAAFDEANGEDPNVVLHDGTTYPKELLYARRMSGWLDRVAPDDHGGEVPLGKHGEVSLWVLDASGSQRGDTDAGQPDSIRRQEAQEGQVSGRREAIEIVVE